MRVLVLHNSYRNQGGEDLAVAGEVDIMRKAGMDVRLETVSNRGISSPVEQARLFLTVANDPKRKIWVQGLCDDYRPDIVHIHNFFPLLTTAVHEGAAERQLPVVQTLHNYRLLCANALFLRNGAVCETCINGNKAVAFLSRCYRGSFAATLAAMRLRQHAARNDIWARHVHRFIALTEFARGKFIEGGLDGDRIVVKPHFVEDVGVMEHSRAGALFVGRLSPEKGAGTLIQAWRSLPHIPLTIVGDGPERSRLMASAPRNVVFTGHLRQDAVTPLMRRAAVLVVPSIAYETFGMTIAEAFSAGLPVIASDIGAPAELVGRSGGGVLFKAGDAADLVRVVTDVLGNSDTLGALSAGARRDYLRRYTPERNLEHLLSIYRDAAQRAKAS
ncbi:2-deoxystreptamine N-acetyl-D-glucosaminyltransferase [Devosia equisanguinis]|uniref:2-deoxystreptamine N-acetyl-D-glucosaminyltransferase n=1 Tax=Devosia equisanguinis TaxID=2490941 RepID=A0A3S5D3D7_9HYPH|nr:glycosyltransferase [Devosia equisanguinis]VDS04586.1 2-deoxystreptamine N-acetyl-D-glucosaminyltransferase [Devosia equisanguinis]